jgi:hypothetical protein
MHGSKQALFAAGTKAWQCAALWLHMRCLTNACLSYLSRLDYEGLFDQGLVARAQSRPATY